MAVVALAPCLFGTSADAQTPLSDDEIARAIAVGSNYRSRQNYLDQGTKASSCQVASIWALDGISKEIRFFTDFDIVAAASAAANAEMRKLTLADAKKLPLTGLLLANVQMTARGEFPVRRLREQYSTQGVHLVLQIGDSLIQPLTKGTVVASTDSRPPSAVLFSWYDLGNTSILTATPLGFQSSRFQQEFAYDLAPATLPAAGKVFLLDADGKRKEASCRFAALTTR